MEIKQSNRYNLIRHLYQPQLGSGLHTKPDTVRYVCIPSNPDEFIDQFQLLYLEKE